MATQPPGHGGSGARLPILLTIFAFLAGRACALASDTATTARTQRTTTHCSTRRDNDLWALTCICPEPWFASRWCARDEAHPRSGFSFRESLSAHFRTHVSHVSSFYHSRLMILCSFPFFVPLSPSFQR